MPKYWFAVVTVLSLMAVVALVLTSLGGMQTFAIAGSPTKVWGHGWTDASVVIHTVDRMGNVTERLGATTDRRRASPFGESSTIRMIIDPTDAWHSPAGN